MTTPVAFVTGASRGIGKACAVHLARAGFDVAISARTVHDGERREHSATVTASDDRPIPGSLSETAACVEAEGRRALTVPADLLDLESMTNAGHTVLDAWGRVDVLVHNGRYVGPGHMDRFLDTPIELLDAPLRGQRARAARAHAGAAADDAHTRRFDDREHDVGRRVRRRDEARRRGWMGHELRRVEGRVPPGRGVPERRVRRPGPALLQRATRRRRDRARARSTRCSSGSATGARRPRWLARSSHGSRPTRSPRSSSAARSRRSSCVTSSACCPTGTARRRIRPGCATTCPGANLQTIETELSARAQAAERSGSGAS